MDSALDHITRELFAQLRGVNNVSQKLSKQKNTDLDTLICPKCSDRLQPMLLKIERDEKDGLDYQTIWWTCRGLKKKTCIFPLNIPTNVFWTRRTTEQMRRGLLPLPNIHLLPPHLHHLYPEIFKSGVQSKDVQRISKATAFTRTDESCSQPNPPTEPNTIVDVVSVEETPMYNETTPTVNERCSNDMTTFKRPVLQVQDLSEQIKYGEADSRRNVELFTDPNSAVATNLYLRYATDSFLSSISSEMSRKKLIKPPLAISQMQRLRVSNYLEKLREASWRNEIESFMPIGDSIGQGYRNGKNRKRKISKIIDEANMMNIPSALKKLEATERAKSLSARLGIVNNARDVIADNSTMSQFSSMSNSQNSNYNTGEVIYEPMGDISNQNSPFVNDHECHSSGTNTSPSTSKPSSESSASQESNGGMHSFPSIGDPELDNLLQRKYREIMAREKFTKRKEDEERPESQVSQEVQVGSAVNETARMTPLDDSPLPNSAVQYNVVSVAQNEVPSGSTDYAYLSNFDPNSIDFPEYSDDLSYGLEFF